MKNEIVVVLPHGRYTVSSLKNAIEATKKWSLKLQKEVCFFARSKKHNIELKCVFEDGKLVSIRTKWNRRIVEPDDDNEFYDVYQDFLTSFHLW